MTLPYRFNGQELLETYRGKKIEFVGDSLSYNMWQSLTCMLHAANPNSKSNYSLDQTGDLFTFSFPVLFPLSLSKWEKIEKGLN